MTLAEYFEKTKIKREEFARKIGVSQAYVSMLCHRKHDPSLELIIKIKRATNGEVRDEDLISTKTAAALAPQAPAVEEQRVT